MRVLVHSDNRLAVFKLIVLRDGADRAACLFAESHEPQPTQLGAQLRRPELNPACSARPLCRYPDTGVRGCSILGNRHTKPARVAKSVVNIVET